MSGGRPSRVLTQLGAPAAASVLLGSLAQIGPPIAALLTLPAQAFGEFSVVYLLFAWGLSMQLSICSEPWTRHRLAVGDSAADTRRFRAVSTAVGLATAVVAAGVAAFVWGTWGLVGGVSVAVFGTVVRHGARYQSVVERGLAGTLRGDVTFVTGLGVGLVLLLPRTSGLTAITGSWAAAALATLVVANPPRWPSPAALREWFAQHGRTIRPLLRDSIILDASAIGGAYALVPLLALQDFGVYRAVSNVATPVRLATEALRPLAGRELSPGGQRLLSVVLFGAGTLSGVAAALAVIGVNRAGLDVGVVNDLQPYAAPVGIFVASSLVGSALYYRARLHASPADLWRGRLWQSGTAVSAPLVGALAAGLDGAVIGTAAATAFGAAVWWKLSRARTGLSRPSPHAATDRPSG